MGSTTILCLLMMAVALARCEYNTFTSSMTTDNSEETFGKFKRIGNKYYMVETKQKVNWYQAWLNCREHDSYLASFDSVQEIHAITAILKGDDNKDGKFWTAGHIVNGNYMWMTDASSVGRNLFEAGKPTSKAHLDCLYMRFTVRDYRLLNDKCDSTFGYICQMEMKILELNAA